MKTSPDVSWYPIPKGSDTCPVCLGTSLIPTTPEQRKYSWWKDVTHLPCNNCGGQTMNQKALGYTLIDPATGKGCKHSFTGRNIGRCYNEYTCIHKCGYKYDIDSGD